ncbi:hypothetical protein HW532_21180 [Kaustia mangrovi]|uniref:Uncharacterized protein n=1 Tax=Kaustia mangrovi TaxID=2593653 RepID=A0A7S8HDT2_9HYPH|nr:hypothetical protein [Kaustia mangrovi]QPC44986.1 hypothetical protein HW532_21180 [Kaustia mangrovi]
MRTLLFEDSASKSNDEKPSGMSVRDINISGPVHQLFVVIDGSSTEPA